MQKDDIIINNRDEKAVKILTAAFVVSEVVVYAAFMFIDIFRGGKNTVALKYVAVCLCFCFSLIWSRNNARENVCVTAAFIFTLIADLFLLVLDDMYLYGVCAFFFAQCCYFARIIIITEKSTKFVGRLFCVGIILTALRLCLPIAVCVMLAVLGLDEPVLYFSAFYFSFLVFNAAQAFVASFREKRILVFAFGLVLFILCDLCVAACNASEFGADILFGSSPFVRAAMWGFYAPSQTLIALSALPSDKADFALNVILRKFRKSR